MNDQTLTRLAVLMPVYAPGPELCRTLDGLRAQSSPFTLFLVDDGSPVKPDYCTLLKGIEYQLIELPVNEGISRALNIGLATLLAQKFSYVARMDCGDIAEPSRFETQLRFLEDHPEIGIVGSWTRLVMEEQRWSYVFAPPTTPEELKRALYQGMPLSHPSLMLRAEVFRKIGYYSADMAAEDYELVRRADKEGIRLANIDRILTVKIENRSSISRKRRARQLLSKLQIQWRYRDLRKPQCIVGLVKSVALLLIPVRLADRLKFAVREGERL